MTMFEALGIPFERILGTTVGRLLAERYRSHGVDLRVEAAAVGFGQGEDGGVRSVRLDDGTEIRCDVALVGIGIEPARELVPDALGGHATYACGGVTASGGHWTSAAAQGVAVARCILGLPPAPPEAPFFWSDQFGMRLQLVGDTTDAAAVEVEGGPESYTARYRDAAGRLVAALAANRPAEVAALRRDIAAPGREKAHARTAGRPAARTT